MCHKFVASSDNSVGDEVFPPIGTVRMVEQAFVDQETGEVLE